MSGPTLNPDPDPDPLAQLRDVVAHLPDDTTPTLTTPGITAELLASLRDQLRTERRYHAQVLLRRTIRRLAIVDLTCQGFSRDSIVAALNCGRSTVTKWRRRYRSSGLNAILDRLETKHPGPRH